jgi:negative regulator of genetic competence, sporulation and motility
MVEQREKRQQREQQFMELYAKDNRYYQSTLLTHQSTQKNKIANQEAIRQLEQKESECFAALEQINCQNATNLQNHFFKDCIKPNAPCDTLHKELDAIQKKKQSLLSEKQYIKQREFDILSAAARHNYLEIIDELVSEEVCNYIYTDGRTVLYDAVRYRNFESVKKILPWVTLETILTKIHFYPGIYHSVIEIATEEIKEYLEKNVMYKKQMALNQGEKLQPLIPWSVGKTRY